MDNNIYKKVDTPSQEKSPQELAPLPALYDPRYYSSAPLVTPTREESHFQLPSIKVELSPIKNILPSISLEVSPRLHPDHAMPSFLPKPEPPPLLPRLSSIANLLSPDTIPQARKLPSSPSSPSASPSLIPLTHPTKPWKQDDVSDVAIALEQLRSVAQGRPVEIDPTATPYGNDSDVSPPNEAEDIMDSRKRPIAAVATPVIITTVQTADMTGSFIKTKPKKKRRKAEQIDRKFPCDYPGCPKSYGSEGALKTHKRLKHPDLPVDGSVTPPQPSMQPVQAVAIHPSQLLHHYANGGSIVQLLPAPQILNSSQMPGSVLTIVHQPTPNTVA